MMAMLWREFAVVPTVLTGQDLGVEDFTVELQVGDFTDLYVIPNMSKRAARKLEKGGEWEFLDRPEHPVLHSSLPHYTMLRYLLPEDPTVEEYLAHFLYPKLDRLRSEL